MVRALAGDSTMTSFFPCALAFDFDFAFDLGFALGFALGLAFALGLGPAFDAALVLGFDFAIRLVFLPRSGAAIYHYPPGRVKGLADFAVEV